MKTRRFLVALAAVLFCTTAAMAKDIQIDHVFKVFGDNPEAALALVREGHSKQDILARTGQSIGVFDAHFDIQAGEIFVIMGLSGSGKSTLVRMLNRLIEPTAGRILIDGQDINALSDKALRALRRKASCKGMRVSDSAMVCLLGVS